MSLNDFQHKYLLPLQPMARCVLNVIAASEPQSICPLIRLRVKPAKTALSQYKYFKLILISGCFLLLFYRTEAKAQKISQLNCYEWMWSFGHPRAAVRAYKISKKIVAGTYTVFKEKKLDQYFNGGKLDAYRHALWMFSLSDKIGEKKALRLGELHEKSNKKRHSKMILEEGEWPDSISTLMDLKNNSMAIELFKEKNYKKESYDSVIFNQIKVGQFYYISRNNNGKYLNCVGEIIPEIELKKWAVEKCLIKTNQ